MKPALALRLGLVVCAIPVGVLETVGHGEELAAVAAAMLLLGVLLVSFIGRLSGS
jgi:hypothetical protein